jgi:hypothetical protein
MTRTCRDCGDSVEGRSYRGRLCIPCYRIRNAAAQRRLKHRGPESGVTLTALVYSGAPCHACGTAVTPSGLCLGCGVTCQGAA